MRKQLVVAAAVVLSAVAVSQSVDARTAVSKVASAPAPKVPVVEAPAPEVAPVSTVVDPGPNPVVPAVDNPAYTPPAAPLDIVFDDERNTARAFRCVDDLGYEYGFSGVEAHEGCVEITPGTASPAP